MLPTTTTSLVLTLALQGTAPDVQVSLPPPDADTRAHAGEHRLTLDVINDGFASIYDEGYSSGARLMLRTGPWLDALALTPAVRRAGATVVAEYWTFAVAHDMWTPADLTADQVWLLEDDRPYAGLASAEAHIDLVLQGGLLEDGYSRLSAELMAGVTGDWSGSERIQRYWHRALRNLTGKDYPKEPEGWDVYEIPNTVLVGLRLGAESEVLRTHVRNGWGALTGAPFGTRASAAADCDLGTFRVGCDVGLTVRAGWMPELTLGGATPIVESAAPSPIPVSAHFILRTKIGVVAYDALLDGPVGTDSPTASKRLVRAHLAMGGILQLWALEIVYLYIIETNELSPLPDFAQPYQRMGHIKLSYRW